MFATLFQKKQAANRLGLYGGSLPYSPTPVGAGSVLRDGHVGVCHLRHRLWTRVAHSGYLYPFRCRATGYTDIAWFRKHWHFVRLPFTTWTAVPALPSPSPPPTHLPPAGRTLDVYRLRIIRTQQHLWTRQNDNPVDGHNRILLTALAHYLATLPAPCGLQRWLVYVLHAQYAYQRHRTAPRATLYARTAYRCCLPLLRGGRLLRQRGLHRSLTPPSYAVFPPHTVLCYCAPRPCAR